MAFFFLCEIISILEVIMVLNILVFILILFLPPSEGYRHKREGNLALNLTQHHSVLSLGHHSIRIHNLP